MYKIPALKIFGKSFLEGVLLGIGYAISMLAILSTSFNNEMSTMKHLEFVEYLIRLTRF